MIVAVPVPHEHVLAFWPGVEPHLERAVERSEDWTLEDLQRRVEAGKCLLWAVLDGTRVIGAAATELHDETAYIALMGGERWPEWADEITDKGEQWARLAGCKRIEVCGRHGWRRLLKGSGYRPGAGGELIKELSHG